MRLAFPTSLPRPWPLTPSLPAFNRSFAGTGHRMDYCRLKHPAV